MHAKCKMTGKEKELPCSAAGCPLFGDCIVDYEKAIKKPQTNADRIRAMSDEELAVFLERTQADVAFNNKSKYAFEWGKWLKQPAEGEGV